MSKYKDVIDEMYDDVAPIPLKLPEQCQSQVPTMNHAPPPSLEESPSLKKDASSGSDEELIAKHLDELSMHVEHQLNINQTSTSAPPPDLLPLQGLQTQL